MASLFTEDFEGGSNGAAVTETNTGFDSVQASFTFASSPAPPAGALWAKVAPASGDSRYATVAFPTTGVFYLRFYFRIDAAPTGAVDLAVTRGANTGRSRVGLTTGRLPTLTNGSTIVWTAPTAVPVGDTHRAELRIDNAAGEQQLRLFLGANRHGTVPDSDSGSRTYNQGSIDTLRIGQVNNAGVLVSYLDAVAIDSSTWPGPLATSPAVATGGAFAASGTLTGVATPLSNIAVGDFVGTGALAGSLIAIPAVAPRVRESFHEWSMWSRAVDYSPDVVLPIISAKVVKQHMGVGRAMVETPLTATRLASLQPGRGVLLYRDGVLEFTGLVAEVNPVFGAKDGRDTIKVSCVGDEQHLADRLTFPDPSRAADDQTVNNYWTATGAASTAMLRLISDQAGPGARADRRVSGLVLGEDPGRGTSRSWSGLFNSVLDQLTLMSVASGANLGVRMTPSAGAMTASIVAPRNLADSIVFSTDLTNLAGVDYRISAPTATHAVSAGQGDLKARLRKLAVTSDALALQWGRQIWSYIDRRDTSDVAELVKAAQDALADGGPTVSLAVTLLDSEAATYGRDWGLGDLVTVYVGRPGEAKVATVSDVVREITIEVDSSGAETIRPAIGSFDATAVIPTPTQKQLHAVGLSLAGLIARN